MESLKQVALLGRVADRYGLPDLRANTSLLTVGTLGRIAQAVVQARGGDRPMTDTPRLHGRIALVTGAAKSLGADIVRRLATCGAHVVVNYFHSVEQAELLRTELAEAGLSAEFIRASVAKPPRSTGCSTWSGSGTAASTSSSTTRPAVRSCRCSTSTTRTGSGPGPPTSWGRTTAPAGRPS